MGSGSEICLLVIKMVYRTKRRVFKRAKRPMMKSTRRKYSSRRPRLNRPDTGYSEKLTSTYDLRTNGGEGLATLNVNWHCVNEQFSNS